MNVFVLCTGRCGSTTFIEACRAMTNYTAAHESKRPGPGNGVEGGYCALRYAERHIEADNRLSWFLGALDEAYGQGAFYVHLLRDREEVAQSFVPRWDNRIANIIFPFAWGILTHPRKKVETLSRRRRLEVGRQYWDTVNANIRLFLRDKPLQMTMWLHDIKGPFEEFWHRIGAEGDLEAAHRVWDVRHNATAAGAAKVHAAGGNGQANRPARQIDAARGHAGCVAVTADAVCVTEPASAELDTARRAVAQAMRIFRRFDLDVLRPRPQPGRWSADLETLGFLVALLEQLQPARVLEFGAGLSTRALAWASRRTSHPFTVVSVDHDQEYLEITRHQLAEQDPSAPVQFVWAPLAARRCAGRVVPVYQGAMEQVGMHAAADLIVVDGPPSSLGGRTGVLSQAMERARAGTVVLLHDADRPAERQTLACWQETFGEAIEVTCLSGFPKGLAVITIVEPVGAADLPDHWMRRIVRDLTRHVGPHQTCVLVDEGRLALDAVDAPRVVPFLEKGGRYAGQPATGREALDELQRLRRAGATHVAVVADCLWWLEHYAELGEYLESRCPCLLRNERLTLYDVRGGERHGELAAG